MPAQTTNLFLLEDLEDAGRTSEPFLFVRHGVTSDCKFFLDNQDWLNLWARRYGESAVNALAEELRRLPWRVGRD
jgi:hypothetical protein